MKVKQNILLLLHILVILVLVFGCANKAKELLTVNYHELSDNDLIQYYHSLNDEIEFLERPPISEVTIGLSTNYRSPYSDSVHENPGVSGQTEELRERRIEIYNALKKKGGPPSGKELNDLTAYINQTVTGR